jgi:hypothetical protein
MILQDGDKVLIVHRRLFEQDRSRYFVGIVDGYEAGIAKVTGYSWYQDTFAGKFVGKHDSRCKILSLASGTLMAYQLPAETDLNKLAFELDGKGSVYLTDHAGFRMNLDEKDHAARPRGA